MNDLDGGAYDDVDALAGLPARWPDCVRPGVVELRSLTEGGLRIKALMGTRLLEPLVALACPVSFVLPLLALVIGDTRDDILCCIANIHSIVQK